MINLDFYSVNYLLKYLILFFVLCFLLVQVVRMLYKNLVCSQVNTDILRKSAFFSEFLLIDMRKSILIGPLMFNNCIIN